MCTVQHGFVFLSFAEGNEKYYPQVAHLKLRECEEI